MQLSTRIFGAIALLISSQISSVHATTDVDALKKQFMADQINNGFSQQEVSDFLNQSTYNQAIIDAITKPWEAKPWYQYYPIFLTEKRLEKGLAFWHENADTIAKAADTFNVDPQIIVAIIGIETFYGSYMGNYRVQDALYTLGFYYAPRATFFRKEYANLMSLIKQEQLEAIVTMQWILAAMAAEIY